MVACGFPTSKKRLACATLGQVAVAVKCFYVETAQDSKELEDVLKEVAMMSRNLHHPNIVGFKGLCFDSPTPLLLLEMCSGGSVDRYYEQQKNLLPGQEFTPKIEEALSWLADMFRGVSCDMVQFRGVSDTGTDTDTDTDTDAWLTLTCFKVRGLSRI